MKVTVRLKETSKAIVFDNAENAYTKGPFYCVYLKDSGIVHKFPVENIFDVQETYPTQP